MKPEQGPMVVSCNATGLTKGQIEKLDSLIDYRIEAQSRLDAARRDFDAAGVKLANFVLSLEAK